MTAAPPPGRYDWLDFNAPLSSELADTLVASLARTSPRTATRRDWEEFELGFLADWEEWLVRWPNAPGAAEIREQADAHRNGYLRGYRDVLGFAYLTLGLPAR